jgi:carboxymethylenebutenolidase
MGSMVDFAVNGTSTPGYLAAPAGGGAGVLVIQEWWGLVPHIKDVCERFAAARFAALAPDLYHGRETAEPDEAGKMMMAMDLPRVAKDMVGAVDHLAGHPAVTSDGIAVVGFCMGGGLALWLSTLSEAVAACVPFYGAVPWAEVKPDYTTSRAAYLGHYSEHDDWASPAVARATEAELRATGHEATFHVYPGTGHAFFNDDRPEAYHAEAATLAWDRTIEFLRRTLAP